jgi:hypothetical protein
MKILITSPMRVGSTWVHEVLTTLLKPERQNYVGNAESAVAMADSVECCVLKSHSIMEAQIPQLAGKLHTIRVLRNFKDCLISRALYCRNVRSLQGLPNTPAETALIQECADLGEADFLNVFLAEHTELESWIQHLVLYERGEFDHTFYYEMLLHNPRDEFWAWMEKVRLSERLGLDTLDHALDHCAFQKMKARKTKGFIGSTGVGQWMTCLHPELAKRLDAMFEQQRIIAGVGPPSQRVVAR